MILDKGNVFNKGKLIYYDYSCMYAIDSIACKVFSRHLLKHSNTVDIGVFYLPSTKVLVTIPRVKPYNICPQKLIIAGPFPRG